MSFATIDALRESLAGPAHPQRSPEYVAKMLHPVPEAEVVDRAAFILSRVKDKVVLDVGASGAMHEAICKVASKCYGIDRPAPMLEHQHMYVGCSAVLEPDSAGTLQEREVMHFMDLDEIGGVIPFHVGVELIVCGEVIEHLGNPLHFLQRLRRVYPGVPVILTTVNAFSDIGRRWLEKNETENVHKEHFAWYSWRTLKTLVERAGYTVREFHWQGGRPLFAEGIIFVME